MPTWAVIITGGSPLHPRAREHLPGAGPGDRFVIAADSGLDHALAAGIVPDLVVGDLDSVSAAGIAWARQHAVPIEVHPTDKDLTDTQIALGAAWSRQIENVILVSGGGDRLDHSISALTALGHPSLGACKNVRAFWGTALVHVLHAPGYWELDLVDDVTFTLLALHGECTRVTLDGARWPLADAVIEPGSSLGVSNIAAGSPRISVGTGVLTVIIPYYLVPDSRSLSTNPSTHRSTNPSTHPGAPT